MNIIDLHVHSTKSDGTYTPTELVDYALTKGLSAFALTDHDTVDGLEEAINYTTSNKLTNIEVIPGIELSSEYHGRDIHILGLYIDYKNPTFQKYLEKFVASRHQRNIEMCEKLQQFGFSITYDILQAKYPLAVITRAHFASYLYHNGMVKSLSEAFERYIGDYAPCFVPRKKITPSEATQLILQANGIPVLAHPMLYRMGKNALEELVKTLKECGLLGIETIYSTYSAADEREIRKLASKYNLLITGGSDFHGANKPTIDLAIGRGKLFIPEELLHKIKASKKRILFSDMDGTLLRDDGSISEAMQDGIKAYTSEGHHLVLTTGRPLSSVLPFCEQYHLVYPNTYIIAFNGALIYDMGKQSPCYQVMLSAQEITYIIKQAKKWGLHIQGYTDTHIVSEKETPELLYYTSRIHLPVLYTDDLTETLAQGSYKLLCINLDNCDKLVDFRNSLKEYASQRLQLIFSNPNFLEICPLHAGKGNAVKFLCEKLNLSVYHAFAAGDAENDLSMLQCVTHSMAMKNASEGVKNIAATTTEEDNNNDGLLPFFKNSTVN